MLVSHVVYHASDLQVSPEHVFVVQAFGAHVSVRAGRKEVSEVMMSFNISHLP